jgi:hypothetical protein
MTRLSRVVTAVNWRYAIGEVVLIVVGILIALAFADWNDRRVERGHELEMLGELRNGLELDLATIEAEQQLISLQQLLANPRPYDPSMDELFGVVYGTRIIFLNTAPYESLKSAGLQMISSDELRLSIARLYSELYEILLINNDIDMGITLETFRPYYLQNFRNLRFKQSATPIDYETIINDPYYHNIVDYRLVVMRANRIKSYTRSIDEIREVLAMLEEELGEGVWQRTGGKT